MHKIGIDSKAILSQEHNASPYVSERRSASVGRMSLNSKSGSKISLQNSAKLMPGCLVGTDLIRPSSKIRIFMEVPTLLSLDIAIANISKLIFILIS